MEVTTTRRTLSFLAATLALAAGCDHALRVRNGAPRVTAVSSASPVGSPGAAAAGALTVVFWIQDHDGDPVDVSAAWLPEASCDALRARLADRAQAPPAIDDEEAGFDFRAVTQIAGAGHGTVGLTSDAVFPGQPHEIAWDTAGVDAADVCLYLIPDDREGDAGDPALSPTFPVATGFNAQPPSPGPAPVADAVQGADAALTD